MANKFDEDFRRISESCQRAQDMRDKLIESEFN